MIAFEIVIIAVVVVSVALCFTRLFRPDYGISKLGRQGRMWFDHQDEYDVSDRPTEDGKDSPLPHRQLRARF